MTGPRRTLDERYAVLIAVIGVLAVAALMAIAMVIQPDSDTGSPSPRPVSSPATVTSPPSPPTMWLGPARPTQF
jgi:hypothetical protein